MGKKSTLTEQIKVIEAKGWEKIGNSGIFTKRWTRENFGAAGYITVYELAALPIPIEKFLQIKEEEAAERLRRMISGEAVPHD